jgi:tRNA pseudouridine38-40 synthase
MTEPTLYPESGFLRLRIDLAYDGTNFSGWAIQPDRRTLQEEVEKAIAMVSQAKIESIVAGRTDAGVHATGQVIHVDVPESLDLNDLAYKLNRILDTDIRITNVSVAPEAFHARFSALRRHYTYKILDENKVVPPLDRFDVASWYRPLDIDLMNKASALVLGQHDFAAFAKFREGATTIRELQRFEWVRDSRGYLVADVVADAFCY